MPNPEARSRPIVGDWLLLLLLAGSLAANVCFGWQLAGRPAPPNPSERPAGPAIGAVVKALDGVGADGTPRSISLASGRHRTVLFVYSPTCPWCKRSWPLFQRLSSRGRDRFDFAALCVGKASDMFPTETPSIGSPTRQTVATLRATNVPQTIVLSPDGRVERVWIGGWVGDVGQQLSAYFGLPLGDVPVGQER